MPHRIAVIAVDGIMPFDLGIPCQVFGAVELDGDQPRYQVDVCSVDGSPVPTASGFSIQVAHDLALLDHADTVLVPGASGRSAAAHGQIDPRLAVALQTAHRRGARIVSICTGAFVLAAAGILDGHRATTHWRFTNRFRRLFPEHELDPDVLFVDEGNVLTSAGVAAGLDLCLHIVRRDFGSATANAAARRCVVPPLRAGGQAQFIERPIPRDDGSRLASVLSWAAHNLDEPITLAGLADRAAMSVRTFTRHFRVQTGQSPAQWLLQQRLGFARELLEETDLPLDHVAHRAGLGTAAHLRSQFQRKLGESPSTYRRTFRQDRYATAAKR